MKTMRFITLLLMLPFCIQPITAQNRCAALKQEKEQLARRIREIDEELRRSCLDIPPPTDCSEKVLFGGGLEVRTQCAEIKGNLLVINFTIRNGQSDNTLRTASIYNNTSLIFDQEGRSFKGKRLTVANKSTDGDYLDVELVYNVLYKGSIEFYIGNQNITKVSLLKFLIWAVEPMNFEDIEIK